MVCITGLIPWCFKAGGISSVQGVEEAGELNIGFRFGSGTLP